MKSYKTAGDDKIVIEAIKGGVYTLLNAVARFFSACLLNTATAAKWYKAVTPIMHEKGDMNQ